MSRGPHHYSGELQGIWQWTRGFPWGSAGERLVLKRLRTGQSWRPIYSWCRSLGRRLVAEVWLRLFVRIRRIFYAPSSHRACDRFPNRPVLWSHLLPKRVICMRIPLLTPLWGLPALTLGLNCQGHMGGYCLYSFSMQTWWDWLLCVLGGTFGGYGRVKVNVHIQ